MSFPTRERGLKFDLGDKDPEKYVVVPHAGTWIEMEKETSIGYPTSVVPHAGTWIEIRATYEVTKSNVVPHAGTWIEIVYLKLLLQVCRSRSPRGNVD